MSHTSVKPGDRFVHARQLRKVAEVPVRQWPRSVCTVTRVTKTAVYYRTEEGAKLTVGWDRLAEFVGEWLDEKGSQ